MKKKNRKREAEDEVERCRRVRETLDRRFKTLDARCAHLQSKEASRSHNKPRVQMPA